MHSVFHTFTAAALQVVGAASCMQVNGLESNKHSPVCSYLDPSSGPAIAADPLVLLPCGHVFHMSAMDQYLALEEAYMKGDEGRWVQERPLQVSCSPASLSS